LITAVKLIRLCGVLIQSAREEEPSYTDRGASKLNRVTSCIIYLHTNEYDNNLQEVFNNLLSKDLRIAC